MFFVSFCGKSLTSQTYSSYYHVIIPTGGSNSCGYSLWPRVSEACHQFNFSSGKFISSKRRSWSFAFKLTFEEEILIIFRTGTPYDVFKIQNFSVLLFMMNQYIIGNPIKPSILTFCWEDANGLINMLKIYSCFIFVNWICLPLAGMCFFRRSRSISSCCWSRGTNGLTTKLVT